MPSATRRAALAGRRRPAVPRRHRPRDVLRRPDRGRPRRRRPRRRPPLRRPHRLGRQPGPLLQAARREEAVDDAADRRRHRRRQRLPEHLRPLRARSSSSPASASRPASSSGYEGRTGHASGCHLHYGLFSPLERGEFAHRSGGRQADEAAARRDRPDRSAPRPAAMARSPVATSPKASGAAAASPVR